MKLEAELVLCSPAHKIRQQIAMIRKTVQSVKAVNVRRQVCDSPVAGHIQHKRGWFRL